MENYEIKQERVEADYIYKAKNNKGQIMKMRFECEEYDNLVYWNVVLWIGKNKRGYEYNQQTGRDGLRSLLWAKQCVKNFIETVDRNNMRQHIIIAWDNNRRKKAYARGLYDLGFRYARLEKRIWLHKTI